VAERPDALTAAAIRAALEAVEYERRQAAETDARRRTIRVVNPKRTEAA
jgi:hypothetical protein